MKDFPSPIYSNPVFLCYRENTKFMVSASHFTKMVPTFKNKNFRDHSCVFKIIEPAHIVTGE